MNWQNRLRSHITLLAPDGTQFDASWTGNDIEAGKLVGQFNTPLGDGTITQDLGSKGLAFPLTLSFEGDDHDIYAMNFLRALSQRGNWQVQHPVYGALTLQPLSATLSADPTGSGNVSRVESSWIEPLPVSGMLISTSELGAQVSAQVDVVDRTAALQFLASLDVTDPEAAAAAVVAGNQGLGIFNSSKLSGLIKGATDLQSTFASAYSQVTSALSAIPMDLINATAQIQTIMALPAMVQTDLMSKITAFTDFASRLGASLTPGDDSSAINSGIVGELFLGGAISGAALSVATSTPDTRDQAVQAINDLRSLFDGITTDLDALQEASAGNNADAQYFSNGMSYSDLSRLVALSCAYLLRLLFDLKIAKRFTLTVPRHPGEIVIAEYAPADSSDYDALYDLFIASNRLTGNDIILLPAGREVVVYV